MVLEPWPLWCQCSALPVVLSCQQGADRCMRQYSSYAGLSSTHTTTRALHWFHRGLGWSPMQRFYLTNRFHVAVRRFRSQMMSKCGKNKKVAHEAQPSVSLMFLPHFDVLCDLLGTLSKNDVDDSENVIWKCNFGFLQSFCNYLSH